MDQVSVTERAAQQIGKILRREAPSTMLRVSVEGGGGQARKSSGGITTLGMVRLPSNTLRECGHLGTAA